MTPQLSDSDRELKEHFLNCRLGDTCKRCNEVLKYHLRCQDSEFKEPTVRRDSYCQERCPVCGNMSLCSSLALEETYCIRCDYMYRWSSKQSPFQQALLVDLPIMEYYEQKYNRNCSDNEVLK